MRARRKLSAARIALQMSEAENVRLRMALGWCLRDRREADKVYLHATSALGPNESSHILAPERPLVRRAREPQIPLPRVDDL